MSPPTTRFEPTPTMPFDSPPTTPFDPRKPVTAMLADVIRALPSAELRGDAEVEVEDAEHDSRAVRPGVLFCAIPGATADGHEHAAAAVGAGAVAILVERWLDVPVPQVKVPSVRAAVGPAAAAVHGNPSQELSVVGTTGTNGKTTICYLLEGAFEAAAWATGVIGTIETRMKGIRQPGVRTTPEGTDLQRLLRSMRTRGVDAVAMEVSSHGLDLHRVDGTRFAVAVFTNLSQDHLDWHDSMEAYFLAKARLFTPALAERGVVFLDGPWARRLQQSTRIPVITVGRDADADVRMVEETVTIDGGRCDLVGSPVGEDPVTVTTRSPGAFNLANAVTAVVAAVTAGVPWDAAIEGVAACPGAPGRFERVGDEPVDDARGPTVLVDYAHTPDAVAQVLDTLRRLLRPGARLTIVLGCGGDRDRQKRGPMGEAAAAADLAVLTSDNPRSEEPMAILQTMAAGAATAVAAGAPAAVVVEPDRRAAIDVALRRAHPGDVVVVAGKGHETTQELRDGTVPFDDREVVASLLADIGGGA
jgi:UDP-N-acetylmuramoyl-L-alanyl-D-glutamate--2,6-diaminopimelate ligase